MRTLTLEELEALPTLATGQTCNLKYDNGNSRVWLSRCTVEDGELFDNKVTVESLTDGMWQTVAVYPAQRPPTNNRKRTCENTTRRGAAPPSQRKATTNRQDTTITELRAVIRFLQSKRCRGADFYGGGVCFKITKKTAIDICRGRIYDLSTTPESQTNDLPRLTLHASRGGVTIWAGTEHTIR
jgi:hypothetical protein